MSRDQKKEIKRCVPKEGWGYLDTLLTEEDWRMGGEGGGVGRGELLLTCRMQYL